MDKELNRFYKNKKVLITGNTGFKGVWLSLTLYHLGAKIYGYSNKQFIQNSFCKFTLKHTNTNQVYGDIVNKEELKLFINESKPDIIFHLAAQPLVSESYKDPFTTINSNVLGTLNVLEVLRTQNRKCSLVVVTSDKCYKVNKDISAYKESDELGGFDPYSMSKSIQEQLVMTYNNSYFNSSNSKINCCTIRSGNVIGGGDLSPTRIIPDVVSAGINNTNIILRNPNAVRPWIYVLDTISAYILAGKAIYTAEIKSGSSYNVGPEKSELLTVKNLVDLFINDLNKDVKVDCELITSFQETDYLFLDTLQIKKDLNWGRKEDIYISIKKTASWYCKYIESPDEAYKYSLSLIEAYFK